MRVISAFPQYFTVKASESSDNFYLPATLIRCDRSLFAWIPRDIKPQIIPHQPGIDFEMNTLFINAAIGWMNRLKVWILTKSPRVDLLRERCNEKYNMKKFCGNIHP